MAAKAVKNDFRSILTSINNKDFAPVYLLMGAEPYYIDRLVEALEKNVVPEEERDFNFSVFYAQDSDMKEVLAACQQYPFMSDRKLVILKEAQSMDRAKARLDIFSEYVKRPNESNVFVIAFKGDNLNATSDLMKAASKSNCVIFKSPTLRDYEVAAPIKDYCSSKRIGIDENAVSMLIEYVGTNLSKLFSEIDKVIVGGIGKEGRITPEHIHNNIGISKEFNNFELTDALAYKNYDKSMRIISYFESNPKANPTIVTTGTLFSFFSKLMIAHFTPDKSDASLMAATGVKSSYTFRSYKAALMKYSPNQTLRAIDLLREFDIKSKGVGSFQNEYALLRELIYNIFTAK